MLCLDFYICGCSCENLILQECQLRLLPLHRWNHGPRPNERPHLGFLLKLYFLLFVKPLQIKVCKISQLICHVFYPVMLAIQNPSKATREVQSNEFKTLDNPECVPVSSETDDSDYSDDESCCSYSDSYYDESSFCEVCCTFFCLN